MNMRKKTRADLDWKNLPFDYMKTDHNIRYHWKDGEWSGGELSRDEYISLHMAAPSLHYGQEAFEGLKAFETKDGRIVVFRPIENSRRLRMSCERIYIPPVPDELFVDAVTKVVAANAEYVPPYGTGASLYIRPLVIGTGARVGLGPASEYLFIVFATPVGPYYKGGFKPVRALVVEDFDRAAPRGVGHCKVGGNYAAGLSGGQYGKDRGYPIVLYLDSAQKRFIDEFSTSNFIALRGNTYITPKSDSILPSITNDSLSVIARDMGMEVERRPVEVKELETFDEVGAVGTAAVITPVSHIRFRDRDYTYGDGDNAGPVITRLYDRLTALQKGDYEDTHGWLHEVR
jgi:branched-chain amino acid aminotransferase